MPDIELSAEQISRIDEVDNAIYDMCKILVEDDELEWDMQYIGEIADIAAEILTAYGKRVRYPAVVTDEDGTEHIEEYVV